MDGGIGLCNMGEGESRRKEAGGRKEVLVYGFYDFPAENTFSASNHYQVCSPSKFTEIQVIDRSVFIGNKMKFCL